MKNKKKEKRIKLDKDPTSQLYKAVVKYIETHNGTAVVVGGIALVQESPLQYNYGIMIRITGKKPILNPNEN